MPSPLTPPEGLVSVVLAGGSGTRLWPLSRAAHPKHLLPLAPDGRTLLRHAYQRAAQLSGEVLVVSAAAQEGAVRSELPELQADHLLLEPEPKGTGPALVWASLRALELHPGALIVSLHADHYIPDEAVVQQALVSAARWAGAAGVLVCVGVQPTWAAPGFGYIEVGDLMTPPKGEPELMPLHRARGFVEKPGSARAAAMIGSEQVLWNTGMFSWPAALLLEEMNRFSPQTLAAVGAAADASAGELGSRWAQVPSGVVERLVLERSQLVAVLGAELAWHDLGSFADLYRVGLEAGGGDRSDNVLVGRVAELDSRANYVRAEGGRTVILIGVEELAVVDSGGVTLVCPLRDAQRVSELVAQLRGSSLQELL